MIRMETWSFHFSLLNEVHTTEHRWSLLFKEVYTRLQTKFYHEYNCTETIEYILITWKIFKIIKFQQICLHSNELEQVLFLLNSNNFVYISIISFKTASLIDLEKNSYSTSKRRQIRNVTIRGKKEKTVTQQLKVNSVHRLTNCTNNYQWKQFDDHFPIGVWQQQTVEETCT